MGHDTAGGTQLTGTGTYTVANDCSGTAQITTPTGTLNYQLARAEGGAVYLMESDPNSLITGSANLENIEQVLPQFVFGGGWYTALYFTNWNATPVSFTVDFIGDSGSPITVPGVSGQVTLAPNATTILEALNRGTLTQGYATVALRVGVTGYGVFRQSVPGRYDREALVSFRSSRSTSSTATWDDTNFTTSVAIVNTSGVAVTVNITAYDNTGKRSGRRLSTWVPTRKPKPHLEVF